MQDSTRPRLVFQDTPSEGALRGRQIALGCDFVAPSATQGGLRMHAIFGLRIQLFPHNMDKQLYTTTSPRRKIFDAVHWYQGTED